MGLPRDETAFFGRDSELAEIERRFAAGARLVTIVGIGGVGKTRLAIESAARLAGAPSSASGSRKIQESTTFVALSGARTIEAAVRAVADALGVRVSAESKAAQALATVADAIATRDELLLVLDEVTHDTLVSTVLDRARKVKVLATAREPTGVNAEEKILLAPLAEADALALFTERARAAAGGEAVDVSSDDAKAIVNRVDRLPLAIEI